MHRLVTVPIALALLFAASVCSFAAEGAQATEPVTRIEKVAAELKALQEGLAQKRVELAKLRHKWLVAKGRTPTPDELKDLKERLKKGPLTKIEENPFINRNPLSPSGRARLAYFDKLQEIKNDEEHAVRLEQELEGLKAK